MEDFGDELPVLTLWRIIEQVQNRLKDLDQPRMIEAVREQFANQFPGTPFPWNEPFVLEVWQQVNETNA